MEKQNFVNIVSDSSEVLLDSLIKNEILKEIPIIGTSINLIRGINNIRDQIYLNKIKFFLENIGELTQKQKDKLIIESKKDEKRRIKFGESLYTTIEQSDSFTKIQYLAIAFEGFLNGDIDDKELRHICHGINRSFIDYLVEIIENDYPDCEILESSVSTGFVTVLHGEILPDLTKSNTSYTTSMLGEKFKEIYKKYS